MNQRAPQQAAEPKEPYNAGNPEHVRKAAEGAKGRARQLKEGLGKIVKDPDCAAWLYELLEFCGIGKTSMTGNSHTFFNEGQRNVGLYIQAQLLKDHQTAYVDMLKKVSVQSINSQRVGERKDSELTETENA